MKTQWPKIYRLSKSSKKREVDSNTSLCQETRKIINLKKLKKEQTKPKVGRRKKIIKIRAEINRKKKIEKINEQKVGYLKI